MMAQLEYIRMQGVGVLSEQAICLLGSLSLVL